MNMRHPTALSVGLLLLMTALDEGSAWVVAQQQAGTNVTESQIHEESPRGRTDDAEGVVRKSDAMILAELRQKAASFHGMLDEYEAKVQENPQAQDQHLEALADWLEEYSLQLTGEIDIRSAIERLVRCVDRTDRARSGVEDNGRRHWTSEQGVAAVVATMCASWKEIDEGLKESTFGRDGGYPGHVPRRHNVPPGLIDYLPSWDGVVLAAIESYRDQRAAEFLMDYALRESQERELDSMAQWALSFLRGFDPEKVKPRIEAALNNERQPTAAYPGPSPSVPRDSQRSTCLRDCLACLEYAQSLSPEDRKAYEYFERSYWWRYAFARRGMRPPLRAAPDWRKGNERFVVDLLKLKATRIPSIPISVPEESLVWLFQCLDSRELPMEAQQRLATMIPYLKWKERQRENEWEEWRRKASERR